MQSVPVGLQRDCVRIVRRLSWLYLNTQGLALAPVVISMKVGRASRN